MIYIENEIIATQIPYNPIYYYKIPKEVILTKTITEHRISEFLYFYCNKTQEGTVHYCPVYMIQWSGYKPIWYRHNQNNIYVKFKNCMQWFFENGYLIDFDIDQYKNSVFQSSLLNMEKLIPDKDFGIIYDFEIKAIMDYKSEYRPLTKSILLLILSYIRAFTWKRVESKSGHSELSKMKKPEICRGQITYMAECIGITRQMFIKGTDVLLELGLITQHKMPRYQDESGSWHTDETIFVCPYKYKTAKDRTITRCTPDEYDFKKELEYGISFVRNQKYSSKKFSQD